MSALLASLASLTLLLPLVSGTLRVSDSARVVLRSSLLEDRAQLNLDDALRADLTLSTPTTELTAAYNPRLSLLDATRSSTRTFALLHTAELSVQHRRPRDVWALSLSGTHGQQSFLDFVTARPVDVANGTPPAPATPLPQTAPLQTLVPDAQRLWVAAASGRGRLFHVWSPRWTSELQLGAQTSGGLGVVALRRLPRQSTADAMVDLSHALTLRHRLTLIGTGARQWTSQRLRWWLMGLSAQWSAELRPDTNSQIELGLLRQDGRAADDSASHAWLWVGSAQLRSVVGLGQGVRAQLLGRVEYRPAINILLGTLQKRLSAIAGADVTYKRVSVALGLSFLQTIPVDAPDATRGWGASTNLLYDISDVVDALLGAQIGRQSVQGFDLPSTLLWSVYAGINVQSATLQF